MQINPNSQQAYKLLHDGTLAFSRVELNGLRIDMEYCERKKKFLTRKIEKLERDFKASNFHTNWVKAIGKKPNIYSGTQIGYYVYEILKCKMVRFTKSGKGSTDDESLSRLNIPEISILLEIKKLKKIRDTYLESFMREQVNGFLHPNFNLNLVTTFRSSSDKPNFQNVPKRDKVAKKITREALYARKGHLLLEADYSGIEFRIAGCYYEDPTMLKYIHDPHSDIHGDIAARAFFIDNFDKKIGNNSYFRSAAKNGFVFPQLYGSWYKRCAINLACEWGGLLEKESWKKGQGKLINGVPLADHFRVHKITNLAKYTEHIQTVEEYYWNDIFKTGKAWQVNAWKAYQKKGFVDSFTGFRYQGQMSINNVLNYPIQGAAFHCLLWSFIEMNKLLMKYKFDSQIVGQIHDAIIFDVLPDELESLQALIRKVTCQDLLEAFPWINVPLDIEIEMAGVDESWNEMK